MFRVVTEHPIAVDSPDHLMPWGTARDNSANLRFIEKLAGLKPRASILDLGCSGGGFVYSAIRHGGVAVGIEGSDYSKLRDRGEWLRIPVNLFTADISKPFQVMNCGDEPYRFDAVTLWEVIEHIAEDGLPMVMENVDLHLTNGGLVILSASPNEEVVGGVTLHQTVRPQEWWAETFDTLGWKNHPEAVEYFEPDWVRGGENAPDSFHFVLTRH